MVLCILRIFDGAFGQHLLKPILVSGTEVGSQEYKNEGSGVLTLRKLTPGKRETRRWDAAV